VVWSQLAIVSFPEHRDHTPVCSPSTTHLWHLCYGCTVCCGRARNHVFFVRFGWRDRTISYPTLLLWGWFSCAIVVITITSGLSDDWDVPEPFVLSGSSVPADYVVVWGFQTHTADNLQADLIFPDDIRPVRRLQPEICTVDLQCVCVRVCVRVCVCGSRFHSSSTDHVQPTRTGLQWLSMRHLGGRASDYIKVNSTGVVK